MQPTFRWMRLLGLAAAASLLAAACGPAATVVPPSPAPTLAPTSVPTLVPTVAPTAAPATAAPAATSTAAPSATTAPTVVVSTPTATAESAVLATTVKLDSPASVALGADGNLYVGLCGQGVDGLPNDHIFAIDGAGMLTRLAGFGFGFGGDGGPALAAQFACLTALAVDGAGHLYVADQANNRVRRIEPDGSISTVAGSGAAQTADGSGPASGGFGGDGGPATAALLSKPVALALDGQGNLYILDQDNNRVRKLDPAGIITTIAGTGTWGFSGDGGPATAAMLGTSNGLAVDAAGNVYLADTDNARIRKIDTKGIIRTIAGTGVHGSTGDGGPAKAAQLSNPGSLAVDAAGNLYFTDEPSKESAWSRIRKISADGTITSVKSGSRSDGDLTPAYAGLAVDAAGNLYAVEVPHSLVSKIDQAGKATTVAGGGAG